MAPLLGCCPICFRCAVSFRYEDPILEMASVSGSIIWMLLCLFQLCCIFQIRRSPDGETAADAGSPVPPLPRGAGSPPQHAPLAVGRRPLPHGAPAPVPLSVPQQCAGSGRAHLAGSRRQVSGSAVVGSSAGLIMPWREIWIVFTRVKWERL